MQPFENHDFFLQVMHYSCTTPNFLTEVQHIFFLIENQQFWWMLYIESINVQYVNSSGVLFTCVR